MKKNAFVWAILIPGLGLILLFYVIPLIYGLSISMTDYSVFHKHNDFIGFANYKKLIDNAGVIRKVLKNTVVFSLIAVLGNFVLSLLLAQLIANIRSGVLKNVFRAVFFIPCIAPMVGTAMVWKSGILDVSDGVFNRILQYFGVAPQNWLSSSTMLLYIIILFTLWADVGFNVILFNNSLETIPKELIEISELEGMGKIKTFFLVKLPLMGRTFSFVCVTTMISYFQAFTQFKMLARTGGANYSSTTMTFYIYLEGVKNGNRDYASAVAMVSFVIILMITLVQLKLMKNDWSYDS